MSEAAEDYESKDDHRGNVLDRSTIKLLWQKFRAIEHEVVRANELCSICSATVSRDFLLLNLQIPGYTCFRQNFAEIFHRSTHCWFCRFLCHVVARYTFHIEFTRCLKANDPLEVSCAGWENKLLLSVNTAAPTASYSLDIDSRRGRNEDWPFVDLWRYGNMTCHSLATPPSRRFRMLLSDTVEQRTHLFNEIGRWLSICESRHPKCSQRAIAFPSCHNGFRVIDVKTRTLCQPAFECSYVALSYVWGKEPFSRTFESDNGPVILSDLLKQINRDLRLPQCLPETIEDAITVTEALGLQYLWVDLICIDQFDPLQKRKAIMSMDKIYVSAFMTICVIDGSDMFSGIPGINLSLRARSQVVTDTEEARYLFTQFSSTRDALDDSNWAKRAWTFQEGELSTRRLCFAEESIFLICREEIFHDLLECDESDDRVKYSLDTRSTHYLALGFDLDMQCWKFDTYARMVASYSRRSITFPSDAHNAMAGAIHRMSNNLNTSFVAALPAHDLFNALLWFNHDNSFLVHEEGRRRPGFPTWSWLGWEGPIEYYFWLQESSHSCLASKCTFSLADRYENVLYHDAVKVNASAHDAFDSVAQDTGNAILKLTTTIARFRVSHVVQPRRNRDSGHRWLLLNRYHQRVGRGDTYHQAEGDLRLGYRRFGSFCSIRLHSSTSDELTKGKAKEVEFVLLQHWSSTASSYAPEKMFDVPGDETPKHNRQFEDTIWTMAIRRTPSGLGERLNNVSIPAKAWFAADP